MARKPGIETLKKKLTSQEFEKQRELYASMSHWYGSVGLSLIDARLNVLKEVSITITIVRFRELITLFNIEKPSVSSRTPTFANRHFC
ncbi:MAG: hypothetical protein HZA34_04470 [Candidatus Pacebacteria bacterium]|nr:hypothetical protein [Candidatus Paceibacterota bacterium]